MSWRIVGAVYLCIAFYFTASISLTLFNKWFFSEKPAEVSNTTMLPVSGVANGDRYSAQQFHFPLTVTCAHQLIVFILVVFSEHNFLAKFVGPIERSRSAFATVAPIGIASGLDWGLSNTSLRWIPLTMYEMVKCSGPIFILLLGWWIGVQQFSTRLAVVVSLLSLGVFLAVTGGHLSAFSSTDFPFQGFVCVVAATVLAGVRIVLAQKALHGSLQTPSIGTATFLFYAAPTSGVALILPAYFFEGPGVARYWQSHTAGDGCWIAFLVFLSSAIAYFLSLSEYLLTKQTSALTLSVCGVAKQALITGLAMMVFHEKMGGVNLLGVLLSLTGIVLYNIMKYQSAQYTSLPREEEMSKQQRVNIDHIESASDTEDAAFARKSEKYSY